MGEQYCFVFNQGRLILPSYANFDDGLTVFRSFDHSALRSYRDNAIRYKKENGTTFSFIDTLHASIEYPDLQSVSLRELLPHFSADDFQQVAQAFQYSLFVHTHQFCGKCGSRMQRVHWEMAMHCHTCNHRCYPRVSPCIIVAVRKEDTVLLAQGPRQKSSGYYSTLAGFVESGETLEQAVHREVYEEVGVQIKNLQYFDSQPWPFPHSLMCGYLAEYASGEIKVDGKEILHADFFEFDKLPTVPPSFSIAGRLIDAARSMGDSRVTK